MLVLWMEVNNMRLQQKLLFLLYVRKYFRIKKKRRQKLMMLINQVLFFFDMGKYASFVGMSMLVMTITKVLRGIWALDRRKLVWGLVDNQHNRDYMNRWKEDFRISGRAFEKLVSLLCGSLERQDTHFQKAIPVKKRVAVALWRLANGYCFRTTSKTLTVRKSTSLEITNKFYEVESRYERFFIKFLINRRDFWRGTEETMLKPL